MPERVVIIGAGGHASDVLGEMERMANRRPPFDVVGLIADDRPDMMRFVGRGVEFLGPVALLADLDPDMAYAWGIGWPWSRRAVHEQLSGTHRAATLVHEDVRSGACDVGEGSVVFRGARLSPGASVGCHVLISYLAAVGHDSTVGDFVSVMPGAMISGDCVLGPGALVGTNATILEGVRIGDNARIGAGAVVTGNVPPGTTVVGVPARAISPER